MKISTFGDKINDNFSIELLNFGTMISTQNMRMELCKKEAKICI